MKIAGARVVVTGPSRTLVTLDIDETLAARYPYRCAYLPVNRLEDGTMWSW